MVSLEDSHSNSNRFPLTRSYYSTAAFANNSSSRIQRHTGRSMRTIRSNFFQDDNSCSFTTATEKSTCLSETTTDSVMDLRLGELASKNNKSAKSSATEELLDISQAFSDFSACSSDISGKLQRLASFPSPENVLKSDGCGEAEKEPERCLRLF